LSLAPGQSYADAWYQSRLLEDRERTDAYSGQEIRAGKSYRQEFRCRTAEGQVRWLEEDVHVETLAPGLWRAVGVCTDVTERKQAAMALAQQARELARSNADLQPFAYVASHDLQKPLRMVASYTQLWAR